MEENLRQQPTNILRITTYGPESTGKTTLARELAAHFNTTWIVEFARDFLIEILDKEGRICEEKDLLPIAIGQVAIENEALKRANKYLFCDTNALVTKVYSDIYYDQCSPELLEAADKHHYDLYFLTDKDIPWEDDGLRDSAEYRDTAFEIFKKNLIAFNKPYIQISGNREERLEKAIKIVENLDKALQAGLTSHEFVALYHQKKNIDLTLKQIDSLKRGIKKTTLEAPATIGNGINTFTFEEIQTFVRHFEKESQAKVLEKFVPASGAATRMFKFLSEFLVDYNPEKESINAYINRTENHTLETFMVGMDKFPFYNEVVNHLNNQYPGYKNLSVNQKQYLFIKTILTDEAFNFLNKPKAVLPFHKYETTILSPIGEHFKESVAYASNANGNIHFTITKEHLELFEAQIATQSEAHKAKCNISYSYQDPSTDSITLNDKGELLKENENQFVFRPGGHGALLYNLNKRNADVIFIKNIDNVSHNNIDEISFYKKGLAGYLLQIQTKVFDNLNALEETQDKPKTVKTVKDFIQNELLLKINTDFEDFKEESQIKILQQFLNRPIRVCGMVKNENEPGGGPFWVKDKKGNLTLQIVESAQVDLQNDFQKSIFSEATHFNPVDLVCAIKNYKGEKFNLLDYTDPETGFVVEKSKNGQAYKSYELPGLWNGSMANWITLFVEVPLTTFNPVKTVNDLLKPAHQPYA